MKELFKIQSKQLEFIGDEVEQRSEITVDVLLFQKFSDI